MIRENEIEKYFDRLWPICRSITGDGLRSSLKILSELVPLELTEVPSGTPVFDWIIPKEWNIRDAYIITPRGKRICDFKISNLHVVNYSTPVNKKVNYADLIKHLHFEINIPHAVPYVTSYYKEDWGFCLSYNEFKELEQAGEYQVFVDSTLSEGSLTYGESVLKGSSGKEILFSTYLCHPSMANNELSGPLVQALLYKKIAALKNRKYTYRFVFAPETIGVIAYLSKIGFHLKEKLEAGFVLTCCGDAGNFVYKRSKKSESLGDRMAEHVLKYQTVPYEVIPFSVGGSDERQYCSPGFNLPVGSLTRSMYQRYKEYHTSLDNKDFISFEAMQTTIEVYFQIVKGLELNDYFVNSIPHCEPQLGKRGLYPHSVNPLFDRRATHNRMHLLSYADGTQDLLKIAELRGASLFDFEEDISALAQAGILVKKLE